MPQDPMIRAMALYRMARDKANPHETRVAQRRLDAHLTKYGIRLLDVQHRVEGVEDAKVRTPPGWATEPWHVLLASQVALLRGNVCGHYEDGHLTVSGTRASGTLKEIQRMRAYLERRIPGKGTPPVASWPWVRPNDLFGYSRPLQMGSVLVHPDSALRIAILSVAFRRDRSLVPQVDRKALLLDVELDPAGVGPGPGRAGEDTEKVLAGHTSEVDCSCSYSGSPTPGKDPWAYPTAEEYVEPPRPRSPTPAWDLSLEAIEEARSEAVYLEQSGPPDIRKRIQEEADRLCFSDVLDRIPRSRRIIFGY